MILKSVPLPLKVLLSYLAVLAAGSVPALIYVEAGFDSRLLRQEAEALTRQARQIASTMAAAPPSDLRDKLLAASRSCGCRLSAIRLSGELFYDSALPEAGTLSDHADRSEVRQILGKEPKEGAVHPGLDGVGVARRTSRTTGDEQLYVAVRVRAPADTPSWILRLAVGTAPALRLQASATTYLRNALSISVSVALLFTLLAAVMFVRPLRRLKTTAEAMADGDFTASADVNTGDEIGDVAAALRKLGTELRRKMAAAGLVEAVALQLVEGLKAPTVLMTQDGEVLAINGSARRLFDIEGPSENEVLGKVAGRKRVRLAFEAAAESGLPVSVDAGTGDDVPLWAHVIRRPADRPLWMLSGGSDLETTAPLPQPEAVHAVALSELLAAVIAQLKPDLDEREVSITYDADELPKLKVAEAEDRCAEAAVQLLKAAVAIAAEADGRLRLRFEQEDTRVGLRTAAAIDEETQEVFDDLLAPVGGELDAELGEATLWLPRA